MSRYWSNYYNKHFPGHRAIPYYGESLPARSYEYSHFPYTYAYDVPHVLNYPRSMYGRGLGTQSEYGYRSPYWYRSELFGYKYPPYLTPEEREYYRDLHHPRYSRHLGWY